LVFKGFLWVFLDKFGLSLLAISSFFLIAAFSTPTMIGKAIFALTGVQLLSSMAKSLLEDPLIKRAKYGDQEKSCAIFIVFMLFLALYIFYISVKNLPIFDLNLFLIALIQSPFAIFIAFNNSLGRFHSLFKIISIASIFGRLSGLITALLVLAIFDGSHAIVAQSTVALVVRAVLLKYMINKVKLKQQMNVTGKQTTKQVFIEILSLGWSLSLRKLLFDLSSRGVPLILGITSSAQVVGIYSVAWRVVELIRSSLTTAINTVFLPIVCKVGLTIEDLRNCYTNWLTLASSFFVPFFVGMGIIGPTLLEKMLREQWTGVGQIMQILCIFALLSMTRVLVTPIRLALGRPQDGLIYEMLGTIISITLMYFLAETAAMAALFIIFRFLLVLPNNIYILYKGLNFSFNEQVRPMVPFIFSSIIMAGGIYLISRMVQFQEFYIEVAVNVIFGATIYFALVYFFAFNKLKDSYQSIKNLRGQ
jgi:O-antigen/teichoic acid export membrane protein